MMNLFITMLVSQNLFAKTFGGTAYTYGISVVQTTDGGYAVAGYTNSFGAGLSDLLVLKLNPDGSLVWARTFGGTGDDQAYSIIQTTDGGYAVAGYTRSFGAGNADFLVLKLNSDGSLVWARTYGETEGDYAASIIQTTDGGYVVAGYTGSFGAGSADFLVLKLNPNGSLAWGRTFGGADNDNAWSIIQTTDGGYAVAGYTSSFGAGSADFLVLKLNSNGSTTWARTFGWAEVEGCFSIIQTTEGGYAVAGLTNSFGAGDENFLVLKLNSDGSADWGRIFGGTDYARSITQTTDGGVAVAGYTSSFGAGDYDFLVLKLNSNGSLAWARTLGGAGKDEAYSVIQTTDGGYAIAGKTSTFGAGLGDILFLKLGPDGNYTGCVQDCSPTVFNVPPGTSSPSVGATCSPSTSIQSPTVTTPTLTITDACPPSVEEADISQPRPGITCSPVPGGALFLAPGNIEIKIYAADGRLAYSGNLEKGENLVKLETGAYLWMAGGL